MFFHTLGRDRRGLTTVAVVRREPEPLGVAITFDREQLPHFTEWKMTRPRAYAVGLEPANCLPFGMAAEEAAGRLQVLQAGEARRYRVVIDVLSSHTEIDAVCARVDEASQSMAAAPPQEDPGGSRTA